MDDEWEPLISDDGQHVGWMTEADDGAMIGLDLAGQIVSAYDPDSGQFLDHGEYALADDSEAGYDDAQAELESRLTDLEAAAYAPREPTYVPVYQQPPLSEQQAADDLAQQAEHLERRLGRPLLLSERRALVAKVSEAEAAGERRPDLRAAEAQLSAEGAPLLDMDSGLPHERREARQEYLRQRISDNERLEAHRRGEDDVSYPEPPGRDAYDLDDRQQRTAYALDRLRGAASPDDTYSAADYDPNEL